MKKTLSLLLALVMVFSLAEPAYAAGLTTGDADLTVERPSVQPKDEIISDGEPDPAAEPEQPGEPAEDPAEDPVEIPDPSKLITEIGKPEGGRESVEDPFGAEDIILEEPDTLCPENTFTIAGENGFVVEVYAPEGALPVGTEMHVSRMADLAPVQAAVDRAANLDGDVQLAADISFTLDGKEIEPAEGSKLVVRMSAPEIEGIASPVVIHIPDGENAVPEVVEQMSAGDVVMADTVSFEASNFSVYAVIDGATGDMARLKVVFMNGETVVETMYLKKADVDRGQVDKAIFDPGVPVDDDKLFMGWTLDNPITFTSEVFDIDQIREKAVAALSGIEEGSDEAVLTLYAKMFKVFYLFYAYQNGDNYVTTKTEVAQVIGESASFTVNENYVPSEPNKGMIGWVLQGSADDESAHVYKNGDTITVTEDTVLEPKVVEGCWIHFFENDGEEGGASYTPPVFVPGGENASSYRPSKKPTRPGYTFDDWYTTATGTEKFNFNQIFVNPPENGYDVYAHWTPNPEASYKIVIWAQSVTDDKDASTKTYDYVKTVDVSGVPSGTKITDDVVAPYTNYDNAFFNVTDLDHGSKAFKFSNWAVKNGVGTDKDEVSPANDTVVNVYYDRMLFTIVFVGAAGGSSQSYYEPADALYTGTVYGLVDGEYVQLTKTVLSKTLVPVKNTDPNTVYDVTTIYRNKDDKALTIDQILNYSGNSDIQDDDLGTIYKRMNTGTNNYTLTTSTSSAYSTLYIKRGSSNQTVHLKVVAKEISYSYNGQPYTGDVYKRVTENAVVYTGLYGQPFSQYGYKWVMPSSGNRWGNVAYLDAFTSNLFGDSMVGATPNLIRLQEDNAPNFTIIFWTQDADNLSNYSEAGRARYYCPSNQGFNITERIQGMESAGYRWSTSDSQPGTWNSVKQMSSSNDGIDSEGRTNVQHGSYDYLHIKYDRQLFDIVFMNGSETVKTVKDIPFGTSISSYQSEAPTIIPGDDSHYFAGWFEDPLGTNPAKWDTTMPLGNKVVYAVTAPVEYHVMVFLNGGALPEGTAQKLNFWVPYETVLDDTNFKNVTYTADDNHTLLGYYTDEACTIPWDFSTKLTGDSLTYTYSGIDDPKRATEHPDYPGENDVGYATTVGYFMLYAGWRDDSILANGGLKVRYVDSENGYEYTDPMHYADKASVIATAAVPEANWPEGMKFEKWQLLDKGNASAVVNSFYPTEEFIADSKYADDNLVITLVPLYVEIDPELPTHIYWYANNGTDEVMKDENVRVNVGVDIPTPANWTPTAAGDGTSSGGAATRATGLSYEDHLFLGWARVETGGDTSDLDEDDLFLRWVEEDGSYEAQNEKGDWVPVTQVACDEYTPYHDLYAVWAAAFYVVHTGKDNAEDEDVKETYYIKRSAATFNLLVKNDGTRAGEPESSITEGYLYGGYYLGAVAPADKKAYNGTNWTFSNPQTTDAAAITPVAGTTYYIKEVPGNIKNASGKYSSDDNYLMPKLAYTYYKQGDGQSFYSMGSIFLISNVDGEIKADGTGAYKDTGFVIGAKDQSNLLSAKTEHQLVIYPEDDPDGSSSTSAKTYTGKGDNGLISYVNVLWRDERDADPDPNLLADDQVVYQYWVTNDGYLVYGYTARYYQHVDEKNVLITCESSFVTRNNYSLEKLATTGD